MSYKIGDRVSYNGVEGVVVNRIKELYEVRLDMKEDRYIFADEIELVMKVESCAFCDGNGALNDVANSDFAITIDKDGDGSYIYIEYENSYGSDWEATYINYCPICGKKLEVAE